MTYRQTKLNSKNPDDSGFHHVHEKFVGIASKHEVMSCLSIFHVLSPDLVYELP